MLAVDYALKPVLAALKAQEMLHGVFADDSQIAYGDNGSSSAQLAPGLEQRLEDALQHFHQALNRRPQPIEPGVLNDRLINARWSI
ncbi:FMN reductase [compost metagenome]